MPRAPGGSSFSLDAPEGRVLAVLHPDPAIAPAGASYVCHEPSPFFALITTQADRPDHVVSDIEPVFAATPVLRGARVQRPTARSQHPTEQTPPRWIAQGGRSQCAARSRSYLLGRALYAEVREGLGFAPTR